MTNAGPKAGVAESVDSVIHSLADASAPSGGSFSGASAGGPVRAPPPATNTAVVRVLGTIVKVGLHKVHMRTESRVKAEGEHYVATYAHFREKTRQANVHVGMIVSFVPSPFPRSPNRLCTDVVILSPVSSMSSSLSSSAPVSVPGGAGNPELRLTSSLPSQSSFSSASGSGADSSRSSPKHLALDELLPAVADDRMDNVLAAAPACQMACSSLRREEFLAIAFEAVPSGLHLAVAGRAGTYLFALGALSDVLDAGLRALLQETRQVKVVFDYRVVAKALASYGVRVESVFDVQQAYAVMHPHRSSSPDMTTVVESVLGSHLGDGHLRKPTAAAEDLVAVAQRLVEVLLDDDQMEAVRRRSNALVLAAAQPPHLSTAGPASMVFRSIAAANAARTRAARAPFAVECDIGAVQALLSQRVSAELRRSVPPEVLSDIILDVGRPLEFVRTDGRVVRVSSCRVEMADLAALSSTCTRREPSGRCAVGDSLHRCASIVDPASGDLTGVTLHLSRTAVGIAEALRDELYPARSVLVLGPAGCGRTTLLRDVARLLASEDLRRPLVIDSFGDVAGGGSLPHPSVGTARVLRVNPGCEHSRVMLDAVYNHAPDALIVDDIASAADAAASVAVRQRGVQLVAGARWRSLSEALAHPELAPLFGGVRIGDMPGGAGSLSAGRRIGSPPFDACVEMLSLQRWHVHHSLADAVDVLLQRGSVVECEIRTLDGVTVAISTDFFPAI